MSHHERRHASGEPDRSTLPPTVVGQKKGGGEQGGKPKKDPPFLHRPIRSDRPLQKRVPKTLESTRGGL